MLDHLHFRELKCNCSALTHPQHLAVQWPKAHPHTPTKSTFDRKDIAWRFRFFREGKYQGNEWTCTICAFLAMMIHWVLRSLRGYNVLLIIFATDVNSVPWRVAAAKVTCAMEMFWWNEIAIGKNSMNSSIWETRDARSRSSGLWRDSFLVGFLSDSKSKAFFKIWKHPKIIQKPMTKQTWTISYYLSVFKPNLHYFSDCQWKCFVCLSRGRVSCIPITRCPNQFSSTVRAGLMARRDNSCSPGTRLTCAETMQLQPVHQVKVQTV